MSRRIVGLDRRALGLFRIGLGLVLVVDLLRYKLPAVHLFYSPAGIFEHYYAALARSMPAHLNLFHHLGSEAAVYAYFGLCLVVCALLLTGFRARVVSVLAFLLYSIIVNSSPAARTPDDMLFGYVLFWSMLLPLGDRYALGRRPRGAAEVRTPAAFAALVAFSLVYFAAGLTSSEETGRWGPVSTGCCASR